MRQREFFVQSGVGSLDFVIRKHLFLYRIEASGHKICFPPTPNAERPARFFAAGAFAQNDTNCGWLFSVILSAAKDLARLRAFAPSPIFIAPLC
jgi:hypothetical protein